MGGSFRRTVKPIVSLFHCPWLSVLAVLVVVGSIPPGDFCFFVFWQICCFRAMDAATLHEKSATIYDYHRCMEWTTKNMAHPSVEHSHDGT